MRNIIIPNALVLPEEKEPRTGGIILANISSREEAEKIIKEDPFYQYQVADYDIIKFIPSKYNEYFKLIKDI